MSFLSAIPFLGKVVEKVFDIVDQNVEDKDLANQLKSKFKILQTETNVRMKELELDGKRIEMEKDKAQKELLGSVVKNHTIPVKQFYYVYLGLVVFNNIFAPIVASFGVVVPDLQLPSEFTSIINVMTGSFFGYHGFKKAVVKKK